MIILRGDTADVFGMDDEDLEIYIDSLPKINNDKKFREIGTMTDYEIDLYL